MQITESQLRRIVRQEIIEESVRHGHISPREGRRLMREAYDATVAANMLIQQLRAHDDDRTADRLEQSVHIRKNLSQAVQLRMQGDGGVAIDDMKGINIESFKLPDGVKDLKALGV